MGWEAKYFIGLLRETLSRSRAWQAYQRDYDQLFTFRDYNTTTGHITFYIHEPKTHLLFKLKGGKYLARDSGITLDISRRFRSGKTLVAFFLNRY